MFYPPGAPCGGVTLRGPLRGAAVRSSALCYFFIRTKIYGPGGPYFSTQWRGPFRASPSYLPPVN